MNQYTIDKVESIKVSSKFMFKVVSAEKVLRVYNCKDWCVKIVNTQLCLNYKHLCVYTFSA